MTKYHKIQTVYLRDPETKFKTILEGEFALPEFEYLANCDWTWTEKVDGTNIRVVVGPDGVTFGGKTDRAQIPAFLVNRLRDLFDPMADKLIEQFPGGAVLYGEGYGAKIQKGGGNYMQDRQDFVLFDVRIGHWWLKRESVVEIAGDHGLDVVPIVGHGTLLQMVEFVRKGFSSAWGDFQAEGVVARPTVELVARNGRRIITKLKYKDFPTQEARVL